MRRGPESRKKLIVVLLRGGLDGLSLIVPPEGESLCRQTPHIAIRKPLDLDGIGAESTHGTPPEALP